MWMFFIVFAHELPCMCLMFSNRNTDGKYLIFVQNIMFVKIDNLHDLSSSLWYRSFVTLRVRHTFGISLAYKSKFYIRYRYRNLACLCCIQFRDLRVSCPKLYPLPYRDRPGNQFGDVNSFIMDWNPMLRRAFIKSESLGTSRTLLKLPS